MVAAKIKWQPPCRATCVPDKMVSKSVTATLKEQYREGPYFVMQLQVEHMDAATLPWPKRKRKTNPWELACKSFWISLEPKNWPVAITLLELTQASHHIDGKDEWENGRNRRSSPSQSVWMKRNSNRILKKLCKPFDQAAMKVVSSSYIITAVSSTVVTY